MFDNNDNYEPGVVSDCCGAEIKFGDICSACGEHADAVEEEPACEECNSTLVVEADDNRVCLNCGRLLKPLTI